LAARQFVTLIDYVPLHVALASPPGGGLWNPVHTNLREGTGYTTAQVAVVHGGATDILEFHGAQVSSLSESQLMEEGIRMRKAIEAATQALDSIEKHLAFRRRL
jgi:hypothetical protein